MKLTYDGFGINDAADKYKARLLTWQRDGAGLYVLTEDKRRELGPLLAAAPELLAALRALLDYVGTCSDGAAQDKARAALARAGRPVSCP